MERFHFTLHIRDGAVEEYDRRHQAVWPELERDLREAGWRNYTIFRNGACVHGYAECHPTIAAAQRALRDSAANRDWQGWFGDVLVQATDGGALTEVAGEIWHLSPSPDGR